jgi:microcystin-dependent protein
MLRLREWFFTITATATKRGTRLKNGDRPTESTFLDLLTSLVFKTEPNDRAKEDDAGANLATLNGHVVAATDVQAKANQSKLSDRTLVAQPSQLPSVVTEGTMTITSPNTPYAEDTPVEITVGVNTERNEFIVNFKSTLTAWFQSLTTFVDNFKADYDAHIIDYNGTKGQVVQNTADIAVLSPGGAPAVVPVGHVGMWMADVATPATFHDLEGGELEQASNPLLFAVLGTTYNNGSETAGYFRLPDMRGQVARGMGASESIGGAVGADSVILNASNLPVHNHGAGSLTTSAEGAHDHDITAGGGSSGPRNHISVDTGDTSYPKSTSNEPAHSHNITGSTDFNVTPNTPVDIIPSALLVKYIIKGE